MSLTEIIFYPEKCRSNRREMLQELFLPISTELCFRWVVEAICWWLYAGWIFEEQGFGGNLLPLPNRDRRRQDVFWISRMVSSCWRKFPFDTDSRYSVNDYTNICLPIILGFSSIGCTINSVPDLCSGEIIRDMNGNQKRLGNTILQSHKLRMHSNTVKWDAEASDYCSPGIGTGNDQKIDQEKCFENFL
jgi:hypothetical protein